MDIKPIGVGILGAGCHNIATDHQLPACLKSKKVNVAALCDHAPGVREFAASCGATAYLDYAEMLADPSVEMVQVATPDQFHAEHAIQALEAGKHVLLQKPPCVNRAELSAIREAARRSGRRVKVLLNQRHSLLSRTIRDALDHWHIGELREIIIRYRGRRFPINNPQSFYLTRESGGVWLHNSLHWLDEAFSYSRILPESVMTVSTRNDKGDRQMLGEGNNGFSAIFPMRQVTFLFEYNTMLLADGMPGGMQRTLIGTHGEIRQEYGSGELICYKFGAVEPEILPLLPCDGDSVVESFRIAIDDFAEEIRSGGEHEPRFEQTAALFELLLQGWEKQYE